MKKPIKAYLCTGLFLLSLNFILGQNQKLADSLIARYQSGNFQENELDLLKRISEEETDPKIVLAYSDSLIIKASKDSLFDYIQNGYLQKGNALRALGNSPSALESYFESLKYAERINDEKGMGVTMISIAGAYSEIELSQNAKIYYKRGISVLRQFNDSIQLANALLNAGDFYFYTGVLDSALFYVREAEDLYHLLDFPLGKAYSSGNLGMVYAEQGKDSLAINKMNEAINILEDLQDYYPITVYLTFLSDIYAEKKDWKQAFDYAERSLELALNYGLKDQISEAYLQLSELYEKNEMNKLSLENYKQFIIYRDSVKNIKAVEDMANLRTNYEVSQKQNEVDLLDQQKKNQQLISLATGIGLLLIIVVAIGLYRRNNFINKAKLLVENEKKRSDLLLLNILPEETAKELKDNGKVQAKRFDSVSVMFTDFKGFTAYSDKLSPEEVVDSIDYYYSKFDDIIEKHGLEKIKTVGDAYMCAGGLPFPTKDHALKMVAAAFEIAEFVNESKKFDPDDMTRFDIRIGINTGPVVAGVVGNKKFAYDIWGDTVNIASRMESNSEPGKINISDNTFQLIKDQYKCTYRGEIDAKNKGMMKMYFVEGMLQNQTSNADV